MTAPSEAPEVGTPDDCSIRAATFSETLEEKLNAAKSAGHESVSLIFSMEDAAAIVEVAHDLELFAAERPWSNYAAGVLLKALNWNAGGLGAIADEIVSRLSNQSREIAELRAERDDLLIKPVPASVVITALQTQLKAATQRAESAEAENNRLLNIRYNEGYKDGKVFAERDALERAAKFVLGCADLSAYSSGFIADSILALATAQGGEGKE